MLLGVLSACLCLPFLPAGSLRVSCVGDSNTEFGGWIEILRARSQDDDFSNFGKQHASVLDDAPKPFVPYRQTQEFQFALAARADIVIFFLGHNDLRADPDRWVMDYRRLILSFQVDTELPPAMTIVVAPPSVSLTEKLRSLHDIAVVVAVRLNSSLHTHDGLHLNARGDSIVAMSLQSGLSKLRGKARSRRALGNPRCWSGPFSYATCCDGRFGPSGNERCWGPPGSDFNFQSCCGVADGAMRPSPPGTPHSPAPRPRPPPVPLASPPEAANPVSRCWAGPYSYEACCDIRYGPSGNVKCWGPPGSGLTFQGCCATAGTTPPAQSSARAELSPPTPAPSQFSSIAYPIPSHVTQRTMELYTQAMLTEQQRWPVARPAYCRQLNGALFLIRVETVSGEIKKTLICVPYVIEELAHVQRFTKELYASLPSTIFTPLQRGVGVTVIGEWQPFDWKSPLLIALGTAAALAAFTDVCAQGWRSLLAGRREEIGGVLAFRLYLSWLTLAIHCAEFGTFDTVDGERHTLVVSRPSWVNLCFAILSVYVRRDCTSKNLLKSWMALAPSCMVRGWLESHVVSYPTLVGTGGHELLRPLDAIWRGTFLPQLFVPGFSGIGQSSWLDPFRTVLQLQLLIFLAGACSKKLPMSVQLVPHMLLLAAAYAMTKDTTHFENYVSLRNVATAALGVNVWVNLPWLHGGRSILALCAWRCLQGGAVNTAALGCLATLELSSAVSGVISSGMPGELLTLVRGLDRLSFGFMQYHDVALRFVLDHMFCGASLPGGWPGVACLMLTVAPLAYACALLQFLLLQHPAAVAFGRLHAVRCRLARRSGAPNGA